MPESAQRCATHIVVALEKSDLLPALPRVRFVLPCIGGGVTTEAASLGMERRIGMGLR